MASATKATRFRHTTSALRRNGCATGRKEMFYEHPDLCPFFGRTAQRPRLCRAVQTRRRGVGRGLATHGAARKSRPFPKRPRAQTPHLPAADQPAGIAGLRRPFLEHVAPRGGSPWRHRPGHPRAEGNLRTHDSIGSQNSLPHRQKIMNTGTIWAFDLGKGSIGEAVRRGNEFLHKASLLIPAEFAETKTAAGRRRMERTRQNELPSRAK